MCGNGEIDVRFNRASHLLFGSDLGFWSFSLGKGWCIALPNMLLLPITLLLSLCAAPMEDPRGFLLALFVEIRCTIFIVVSSCLAFGSV